MQKLILLLTISISFFCFGKNKMHVLTSPNKIIVQKIGHEIRVLSRFSADKNVFNRFVEGNNISAFLPCDAPFESGMQAKPFHIGWDDFAPFLLNGYQDIGANHGSIFTFRVSIPRHWLTDKDIGRVLTDDAGHKFIIVDIVNKSDFLIHSEYTRDGNKISFHSAVCGSLYLDGVKVAATQIKRVQLSQRGVEQLSVHNRYNSMKLLADGQREIADGEIVECNFARLEWDIDLCAPDALLDYIKEHPGVYTSPTAPGLASFASSKMSFVFQPNSAYTADVTITFHKDHDQSALYGFLQSYGTTGFTSHEKFIPKMKPFLFADFYWYPKEIDLAKPFQIPDFPPIAQTFTKNDAIDPNNPPDRYIDLFGNNGKRELGVALGYSLEHGITKKGSADRGAIILYFPATRKIYPYALNLETVKAGSSYRICAYRQYFDPAASKATALYGHWEDGAYYLYANYLSSAEETVSLPPSLANQNIKVVEMLGKAILPTQVSADGKLTIKVDNQASFVLKIVR